MAPCLEYSRAPSPSLLLTLACGPARHHSWETRDSHRCLSEGEEGGAENGALSEGPGNVAGSENDKASNVATV